MYLLQYIYGSTNRLPPCQSSPGWGTGATAAGGAQGRFALRNMESLRRGKLHRWEQRRLVEKLNPSEKDDIYLI